MQARIFRANRLKEKLQELLTDGTILIDTTGSRIGQVNGLSVIMLGDHAFGRPSRVDRDRLHGTERHCQYSIDPPVLPFLSVVSQECVLDEADEMLALGFLEDMETILAQLPPERQIALFSATMPPRIVALAKQFLHTPERISIAAKRRMVATTTQTYYEVSPGKKREALCRVLDLETPGPTIVFCRTRKETDELAETLRLRGYSAEALHGDMAQAERDRVMRRFREGQSDLLIATDVAARGLDIETVTHVINYDIPWDAEQYIHRVGRTGRAGRAGDAITLIEPRERRQLRVLEHLIGAKITPARMPTAADIAARRRALFLDALREALAAGVYDGHLETVEALAEEYDLAEVAAALHLFWKTWTGTPQETAVAVAADGDRNRA